MKEIFFKQNKKQRVLRDAYTKAKIKQTSQMYNTVKARRK